MHRIEYTLQILLQSQEVRVALLLRHFRSVAHQLQDKHTRTSGQHRVSCTFEATSVFAREREREREIIISYEQVLDEVQLPTKIVLALAVVRHCQHPHKATLMKDQDTVLNLDAGKVLVESLDRNE